MGMFDNVREQAENLANQNPDKVEELSDQVLDKGQEAVSGATGGKFDDQIKQGRDAADGAIGNAEA